MRHPQGGSQESALRMRSVDEQPWEALAGALFVTRFALPYCPAASLCAGQVRRPVVAEMHGGREVGKSVAARR